MMQPIAAITQLEPIDGMCFNMSAQLMNTLRTSLAWNYGMLSEINHMDLCITLLNPSQEDPSPYNDFLTAELSGLRGFTAIGSYIPMKSLGLIFKGEGNISNLKEIKNSPYMFEIRKMLGAQHIGVYKKRDSFGVNYLQRISPEQSYGFQLGFTV